MLKEYEARSRRFEGSNTYALSNPAYLFLVQRRQMHTIALLSKYLEFPLTEKKILEVGCGQGQVLYEYLGYSSKPGNIVGIDLLENKLQKAHGFLPHIGIACANGQNLPFRQHSFDLVTQYMAFSSILDDSVKAQLAAEMLRVVKPNGVILWYDFWINLTNRQTRGIRPSEIKTLFPNCAYEFRKITLAPPITRRLVGASWLLCSVLERLWLLNTHYLAAIRPLTGAV